MYGVFFSIFFVFFLKCFFNKRIWNNVNISIRTLSQCFNLIGYATSQLFRDKLSVKRVAQQSVVLNKMENDMSRKMTILCTLDFYA